MYEQFGRYYAFFGAQASVTSEEQRFLAHWTVGRRCALDFGSGLCEPALILAELGLEVFAFEPSPILALLAMDRLSRGSEPSRSITLLEGRAEDLSESFKADFILMRSVLMLLNNDERQTALRAVVRHAAPEAQFVFDVRTPALAWANEKIQMQERYLGRTLFRRISTYERTSDGGTVVHCVVEADRNGKALRVAEEDFTIRTDSAEGLRDLLSETGFEVLQLYGKYDLTKTYEKSDEMIVAVARNSR
jgi:SAM-dependent methyltransferase